VVLWMCPYVGCAHGEAKPRPQSTKKIILGGLHCILLYLHVGVVPKPNAKHP